MSWLQVYGKDYPTWCKEKAERLYSILKWHYEKGKPLDFQLMADKLYFERLVKESKLEWEPIGNQFSNFKPSPFMKDFLYFVRDKLLMDGFLKSVFRVEVVYQDGSSETFTFMVEVPEDEDQVWSKVKELETVKPKSLRVLRDDVLKALPPLDWLVDVCTFSIEE